MEAVNTSCPLDVEKTLHALASLGLPTAPRHYLLRCDADVAQLAAVRAGVDTIEHGAWLVVGLVVAAQIARIVVRHDHVVDGLRSKSPLRDQVGQELRVVDDLVVATEVGVLRPNGVEAMRAGGDDRFDPRLLGRVEVRAGRRERSRDREAEHDPPYGLAAPARGKAES